MTANGKQTLSHRVEHILEHHYTHAAVIWLLIIDIMLVVASIALEIEYLTTQINDCEDIVTVCADQVANLTGSSPHERLLSTPEHGAHEAHGAHAMCPEAGHAPHFGNHDFHTVESALAKVSLTILFIFLLENLLLMGATRIRYFASPLKILDFVVIVLSIWLEIAFSNSPEGGLLVIARIWRFMRIGHGLYESAHLAADEDMKGQLMHLSERINKTYHLFASKVPKSEDVSHGHGHGHGGHGHAIDTLSKDEAIAHLQLIHEQDPHILLELLATAGSYMSVCEEQGRLTISDGEGVEMTNPGNPGRSSSESEPEKRLSVQSV